MKSGIYLFIIIFSLSICSCNKEDRLQEVPQDFLTVGNAYTKPSDFETAIAEIYYDVRSYKTAAVSGFNDFWCGTDVAWRGDNPTGDPLSNHNLFNATSFYPIRRWKDGYKIIANANAVLGRIEEVTFSDDAQKKALTAQAYFFRAWTYRILAILFGDVPLVLDEITEPKSDFVRTPRTDVFQQCKADLEYAVENLKGITEVQDGRVSKEAAYHLLSEVSLCLGDFQGAVDAASKVIDNPAMGLMTERFGSQKTNPGDPYWDLFRLNNQNRGSGNKEAIWVLQVEFNKGPGSWGDPTGDADRLERVWGPQYYVSKGPDGALLFIGPTDYNGGRGSAEMRLSGYALQTIWESDYSNDLRNAEHLIKRKWWIDNPASGFYNDTIDLNKPYTDWQHFLRGPAQLEQDTNYYIFPYPLKFCLTNQHFPVDLVNGGPLLTANSARSYMDLYEMRLAETYLLRAEGYLGLGNTTAAAADINKLRARANASLVDPADVNLDYILDERTRELYCEEPRRLTLGRLGLIYDRAKRYNTYAKSSIQPFNNLWPIPFSEIEKNVFDELTQNPGYE